MSDRPEPPETVANTAPEVKFGRFRVLGLLGQGAMGVVYKAEDPVLGRPVAIKVVQIHAGLSEPEIAELSLRFENEARSAAGLSHPNLVPVYDAGTERGSLYLAMEYVAGESLAHVMKSDRVLTYKEIADLALQIGGALDHAHRRGIVHRDIKPANILLTRAGVPKITDFGVARQATSELTATGTILGTPAYMSPEQITGHKITGASDQFSLAILLYEMLTRRRPFDGEGATTILYKIVHEQPATPDEVSAELPRAASAPLLRALSKNPAERFGNCVEFAGAIRAALGAADAEPTLALAAGTSAADPAVATPSRQPAAAAAAAGPTTPAPAWWQRVGLSSPPPALAFVGAAGLLAITVLLAAWGLGTGRDDAAPMPSAPAEVAGSGSAPAAGGSETAPAQPVEATPGAGTPRAAGDPTEGTAPTASTSPPGAAGTGPLAESGGTVIFRVTSQPPGADVALDGVAVGSTPIDVELDPARRYAIRLTSDGYEPLSWAFTVGNLSEEQQAAGALFFPLGATASAATGPVGLPEDLLPVDLPPVDPVRIRGEIQAPTILEKTDPDFPAWAAQEGLPNYVILELVVDELGYVRSARVLREVHPVLEEMALASVRSWRLQPATDEGAPVAVFFNATVTFRKDE